MNQDRSTSVVNGPRRHVLIACALLGLSGGLQAAEPATYESEAWLRAQFDAEGKLQMLEPQDESSQPAAVWSAIRERLAPAKITPPQVDGRPAVFRTGLRVALEVNRTGSDGAQVRIRSLQPTVLPLELSWVATPDNVSRTPGWDGTFTIRCGVVLTGECGQVDVDLLPGMPDSLRKWARQSATSWRFEVQQLNGQPVPGEYQIKVNMFTRDALPRRFIGKDQRL